MALMELVELKYRNSIKSCSKSLETEESSKILAQLQGELAASKLFIYVLEKKHGLTRINIVDMEEPDHDDFDFRAFDDQTIVKLETQRLQLEKSIAWNDVLDSLNNYREEKKNWLFFYAEKGRDLDFTHAWRDALKQYQWVLNGISDEYVRRVEQNPLFSKDFEIGEV